MRSRRRNPDPAASTEPAQVGDPRPVDSVRSDAVRRRVVVRKVASVLMIGVFALALWKSQEFSGLGKWFPQMASGIGLGVAVVHAILVLLNKDLGRAAFDTGNEELGHDDGLKAVEVPQSRVLGALGAFPALVVVAGFIPAVVIWLPLFFRYIAAQRWWVALVESAAALGVLYLLQLYIGMVFPESWFMG